MNLKSKKYKLNRINGFTLAELLVSIFIFAIITGMAIANFRGGRRSDNLKVEANALVSNIRRAQSMALAGELYGELPNRAVPPGGYGLYFDLCVSSPCSYKIFADFPDPNDNGKLGSYQEGEEIGGGTITTAKGIIITALTPAAPSLVITFKPPKPLIFINGAQTPNEAIITITDNSTNEVKNIKLNRISGLASIE